MNFFRTGKFRFLYLLALVQLVGGPLVLFQVTLFCKLTLNEAPRMGMAKAAVSAWESEDFQAILTPAEIAKADDSKTTPSGKAPKVKLEKAKEPVIPWMVARLHLAALAVRCDVVDRERFWTPAWPQAPPGPPPRMG
ncbi:MAG: hypothetical protein V4689_01320 [Verrucomicrobiota bacterium]